MIKSFKDKETETIFNGRFSKKISINIQKSALRKLIMLDNSNCLNDLRIPPSNHLEKLSGELKNNWSIRINDQYRIVFKVGEDESEYYDVEIVDYH